MSKKAPNFFKVATQPKWIGALLLSLAVAAIFAALGQWQLDRAFTKDQPAQQKLETQSVSVKLATKNVYVVANRLQKGVDGYWLVTNSIDAQNKSLTIALGWSQNLAEVEGERNALMTSGLEKFDTKLEGVFIPSESPLPQKKAKPYILESLSLAQLLNFYSPDKAIATQPQILVLNGSSQASAWPPLQAIDVSYDQAETINWLSAFYFLEWLVFAGFAVFLWWRLVRDEQMLLSGKR